MIIRGLRNTSFFFFPATLKTAKYVLLALYRTVFAYYCILQLISLGAPGVCPLVKLI